MGWRAGIADWIDGETAYVSVPFTWLLPQAYERASWFACQGYRVRAGGPGVALMPDYLRDIAEIGGDVDALPRHGLEIPS